MEEVGSTPSYWLVTKFSTPSKSAHEDADFNHFSGMNVTEFLTVNNFSGHVNDKKKAIDAINTYIERPDVVDVQVKFNGYRYKLYYS